MPIEIRFIEGEACPVIVCDITGKVIRDAAEANAYWVEGGENPRVHFALKAHDNDANRPRRSSWYDLQVFLLWLGINCRFDPLKAQAQAQYRMADGVLPDHEVE